MPLHIWLKEPPVQLLIEGERIRRRDWRKRILGLFPRRILVRALNQGMMMLDAANVLMVKVVTSQEIEEAKKKAEATRQSGKRVQPAMMIPSIRKGA